MTYPDDSSTPIRSEPPSLQPPGDVPVRILVRRGALGVAIDALLPLGPDHRSAHWHHHCCRDRG
jgi:hypothetical protein